MHDGYGPDPGKRIILHRFPEAFEGEQGVVLVRGANDGQKLLAAVAEQKIVLPEGPYHEVGHQNEHLVAEHVPVGVVDLFEIVDVEHAQPELVFGARGCAL